MLDHPVIVELSRNLALVLSVGVMATLALLLRMSTRRRKSAERAGVVAQAPAAANARRRLDDLTKRLKNADNASLAALYLQVAGAHRDLGDDAARLTALRSAAGLGAIHGARADHAQARLELAEAAYAAGDLTGACEQWQMARIALLEDGQKEAYARIDKRMRDQGCPTDWVLTDF